MHIHPLDVLARQALRPRASQGILLAAQLLRLHEYRELPIPALAYREAAAAVREELGRRSTTWLLQMRLRVPPVVQGLVEDELDRRRTLPGPRLSLASPLMQVPAYDEAWRRQAAAAVWKEVEARLRTPVS